MNTTDHHRLGIEPAKIRHWFGTPPEIDRFRTPNRDVKHWSETGFFQAYNPVDKVGVFTHVGRCQQDLDLWWSHTLIFLPNGEILADRSFGRSPDDRGVHAGASRIIVEEPFKRWRSVFDGHGERTTTVGLAAGVRGAGPGVAVRYDVTGFAAGPVWDLTADNDGAPPGGDWAGDGHYQQNFLTQGTLIVAGKTYSLDGIGWNDHSRGPRTFEHYGTHRWISAVLPGATLHAISVWDVVGTRRTAAGSLFREDDKEHVSVEFPAISDTIGGPRDYEIVLTKTTGGTLPLKARTLLAQMLTITGDNDNVNGIYWDGDDGSTVHWDSTVELTLPDGQRGYGYAERGMRLKDLKNKFPRV
jgi:hypothetical protein